MSARELDGLARGSRRSDFGVWERGGERLRAVWLERRGELFAVDLGGARPPRPLARLPASGHPDPERAALVAEAALHGWAEQSGRPRSLDWLERRLGELGAARLEPIDWTAACERPGCPRQAEPIAPAGGDWGERCAACLGGLVVAGRGLSPARLEAALRAGGWRLADAGAGDDDRGGRA